MKTQTVTDLAEFRNLKTQWHSLWERSDLSIFLHHAWLEAWWSGTADRRDIKAVVVLAWDGERLCGAAPFAIYRRANIRVLSWMAQLYSDYCDCLVDPSYRAPAVLHVMWDVMRLFGGFDLVNLQQVRQGATCRPLLDESRCFVYQPRAERCLGIENRWADGQAFFRSLTKKARNNHTRGKRILAEMAGDPVMRIIEPVDDLTEPLGTLLSLKRKWLLKHDPGSDLLGPDEELLKRMLLAAWQTGLARIFQLNCAKQVTAASMNFIYHNRMEAYFTAFDAAFDRASPGTILIVDYVMWSFDRKLKYVDFLRGEEAFKFRLANAETVLTSYSGANTLVGRLALSGHRLLSRWRRGRERPSVEDRQAAE